MKVHRLVRVLVLPPLSGILALLAVGCGTDAERTPGGAVLDTLVGADAIVSTASELIGQATDLQVGTQGRFYIADHAYKRVLSIRPDGSDPRMIGGEGSGPGEFQRPTAIAVAADTLWAFDITQSRVQAFARDGAFLRAYAVAAPQMGGGRALNRTGELAAAVGGLDSVLVAVLGAAGQALRSFGRPVVPANRMWDFTSIKARIREGEVPDEFRNDALPVWLDDGSIVVAFLAEPEVRRYGPNGALLWSRPLADPVVESARAAFIRRNMEEQNPARLHGLRYVVDVEAVGNEVWVMLNASEEDHGGILGLDAADGTLTRRLVLAGLPGAGQFTVDPARDRLYVSVGDEAMVVAFDLEL